MQPPVVHEQDNDLRMEDAETVDTFPAKVNDTLSSNTRNDVARR